MRFAADGKVECPDENPGFMELLGTRFTAHPPIAPFKVDVTRGDVLYLTRRTSDIAVLLLTSFSGSCPEFRDEHWDEAEVPVLYERHVGQGGILYFTLGHCCGHYDLRPVVAFWPHPQRCG